MSINSMTNDELRRNLEFQERAQIREQERAAAESFDAPSSTDPSGPAATEKAIQENRVTNALDMLVKYIPTEAVTLYIAAVSAAPALNATFPFMDAKAIYWTFAVITPLLLLLVYIGKRRMENMQALPPLGELPWWTMIAATIAFLVWALAIPNNPYVQGDAGAVLAGFGAIFISTLLSMLEPIFAQRPKP
jgi:hypothetical protein